jgi:hypothetical protein
MNEKKLEERIKKRRRGEEREKEKEKRKRGKIQKPYLPQTAVPLQGIDPSPLAIVRTPP